MRLLRRKCQFYCSGESREADLAGFNADLDRYGVSQSVSSALHHAQRVGGAVDLQRDWPCHRNRSFKSVGNVWILPVNEA